MNGAVQHIITLDVILLHMSLVFFNLLPVLCDAHCDLTDCPSLPCEQTESQGVTDSATKDSFRLSFCTVPLIHVVRLCDRDAAAERYDHYCVACIANDTVAPSKCV